MVKRIRSTGLRFMAVGALVCLAAACASGGGPRTVEGAGSPRRPLDPVERAEFAPSLQVHLDSMVRRASGLYVRDLITGTGTPALTGRSVVVRYTGWLANGEQFDSGEITVTLGTKKTIQAWEEGLLGIRVGGKRRLVVPPSLGYGSRGAGRIPPNAVLVFDVEARSVL